MKSIADAVIQFVQHLDWLAPALTGGIVDYLTQIKKGSTKGTFAGMLIHIISALYFGWLVGEMVIAMGYKNEWYGASCGIGGLMGTRVAEIGLYLVYKKLGK